jgi:hypothetical protein
MRLRRNNFAACTWFGSEMVWWRAQMRSWSATSSPSQNAWTRSRSARTSTRRPTAAGSGGKYTGRSSATRAESTRIERVQPIRSAITVARHRWIGLQQLPDPRLHLINNRTLQRPLIFRWFLFGQRVLDGVLRYPQHPGDRLDRQPLRPIQPTNLCPILPLTTFPSGPPGSDKARPPDQGVKIRMPRRGQFSRAADT